MDTKKFIQVSDINLASTLLCLDYSVLGINDYDPNRVYFYFEDSPKVQNSIKDYWGNKLNVNPKEFSSYRKELLSRIHQKYKA